MAPHIMSRWAPASEPPITAPRVAPHLGPQLPVAPRVAQTGRAEPGAQLVGDDDVEQHVERVDAVAALVGDLADRAALVAAVLRREGLDHLEAAPVGQAAEHARLLGVGPARRAVGAPSGSDSARIRSGTGSDSTSRHPGRPSSTKPGQERQPQPHRVRQRERDDPAAALGGVVRRGELRLVAGRVQRRHAEHVPVQRAAGGRPTCAARSSRSSSVKPLMQPARIASSVVPWHVAHGAGQRDELVVAGAARRHRVAVAVVVGRGGRGREAEGAGRAAPR